MDALLLQERVRNTIQLGESHFREFKTALEGKPGSKKPRIVKSICRDISEALVAFANADGGELVIGVEDDGTITGLPHAEEEIEAMLAAPKTHVYQDSVLPIITASKLMIDNTLILFFSVSKGTTEIYQLSDGRCVRRKDKETVPITFEQIRFDRQEIKSREYDQQFVDGATVTDLDVESVQSIADNYLKGLSIERYLQQIGLAEYASNGLRLRRAALLLFAKDISRWHPRSQVRILRVAGTHLHSGEKYNVTSDETVSGSIFDLLLTSWEHLRPFLAYRTEFGVDAKFEQKYIFPEGACRETLINALAHRDYTVQSGIEVFIFDDRIEIKNPGALLSTLTVEDLQALQGAHESRNVLIAKALRENKFMRELGEGMRRMFELMEENELEPPILQSDRTAFTVTLPHKSVFTLQQEQWLQLFEAFDLSPHQRKIVVIGMDGREISPKEIYRAMNTDDRDTYDREVTGLRLSKILQEIRGNVSASNYARSHEIRKEDVPRFKVVAPQTHTSNTAISPRNNPKACIYIGNLPDSAKQHVIKKIFERFGVIEKVELVKDTSTNRSKGFGFIWFQDEVAAQKAIQELNGFELDGRKLAVAQYRPR